MENLIKYKMNFYIVDGEEIYSEPSDEEYQRANRKEIKILLIEDNKTYQFISGAWVELCLMH